MTNADHLPPSPNGTVPDGSTPDATLAVLRARPVNVHGFGGLGPLLVGIVLFVLMVTLAPTVAPERTVERPIEVMTTTEATP